MTEDDQDLHPTVDSDPDDLAETVAVSSAAAGRAGDRPLPQQIGGYRILGLLGEGGMGVVYEAEQPSPRRLVALKVIRGAEFVDDARLKMFEREAATLARLDHPNIGRIFQSGRTEEGRHFFAMELVRGPSLAGWLSARPAVPDRAEIELRLRLFRQVCDAVHYAHQRGVIHRDLKPSNLIVTDVQQTTSGTGSDSFPTAMVKILDFGLARMTEEDVAATQVTEVGVIKGTLPYMAPEQARGDAAAIDVRTDVYALGVILYELLTGQRPYSVETGSLLTALAVICDQSPRPLSEQWRATMRLDPDLATIVSAALEKDPERRYSSAAAFSEDIGRFLTSLPILARPPSTMYQIQKLVERKKPLFATAAAALFLLVAASIGIAILYVRSEANRARAVQAEATARREAETADRTSKFLVGLFDRANPERTRGATLTAKDVMDEGARSVARELAGEPVVEARLMLTLGQVYRSLGLYEPAFGLITQAVDLRRKNLPPDGKDVAEAVQELAQVLEDRGRNPEADGSFREAIGLYEKLGAEGTDGLIVALGNHASLLTGDGRFAAADSAVDRALALANGRNPVDERQIITLLERQAAIRMDVGQPDSGLVILTRALETSRRVNGGQDNVTANILTNIGVAHAMAGRPADAARYAAEALALNRTIYGDDHPTTARSYGNVGIHLAEQGHFSEARPYFQQVLDIGTRVHGAVHPVVAQAWMNLGLLSLQSGDARRAVQELQRSVDIHVALGDTTTPAYGLRLYHMAGARLALGDAREARRLMLRVIAIDEKVFGPDSKSVADDLEGLVEIERKLGHTKEADSAEARMNAILKATATPPPAEPGQTP